MNTSPSVSSLPGRIEDRNGNVITTTDSGNGAFTITDTAGRPAIISNGFGSTGNTVAVSGLAEPYRVNWETINANYGVGSTLISNEAPNCPGTMPTVYGSESVVSSIALPNGQSYQFFYDPTFGLISKIVFPTGGYVRYVWGINAQSEMGVFTDKNGEPYGCEYTYGAPAVTDRYISDDGVNEVQHQTFTYSTTWGTGGWTAKASTVTTYDLARGGSFETQYSYGPETVANPPDDDSLFASQVPLENTVAYYDGNGKLLRTVAKNWQDPYAMTGEKVTLDNGQTSETSLTYSSTSQLTDKYEYDYGGTLLRHTHTNYASFGSTGIDDRPSSVITYDGSGSRVAETDYAYDQTGVRGSFGITGHDDVNYGTSFNNRGNATTKTEWLNTGGASPVTTYTYDLTGQMLTMTDPNKNVTSYAYADHYASGSPPGQTNAYLTQITYPQTDFAHVVKFSDNYAGGQLATSTDQNGNTTSYAYSDPLDRLTQINYPDGGKTQYSYNDSPPSPSVTTTKAITSSQNDVSTSIMDGVGHAVRTELTSDPAGTDYTDTTYDGEGRAWTQSNPYRSTGDPSYGITTTAYDALGRVTSVTRPDGNVASTSYSGNCTTATDEQGKTRESCSDGLGRLTLVVEDPSGLNYHTTYTYDALDNLLTSVDGGQTRRFTYDSLSRQLSASNPESGAKAYTYDANGNVLTRTDARGITTTYKYDVLNRLTAKSYSDGTPVANFVYDWNSASLGNWSVFYLTNTIGRLFATCTDPSIASCSAASTGTIFSYDSMGRVTRYWQCTPYNCGSSAWQSSYNYDLAGDVQQWTHPAGFTITNTINAAQEVTQIQSSLVDASHPQYLAQNITYTPWGAESTLENGCAGSGCTNTQETYAYNKRLQPVMIELGTTTNAAADYCLVYNYYPNVANPSSCSNPAQGGYNGGNVTGYFYQDNVNPSLSHTAAYTYDALSRLTQALATGNSTYNLTFIYDRYGNMTCTINGNTNGLCPQYSFNEADNRITNTGYTYDSAGNLTGDGTHTYQYDAEGRETALDGGSTWWTTYNVFGQVAQRYTAGETDSYLWDSSGYVAANYDQNGAWWWDEWVHSGGRALADYRQLESTAWVFHVDTLDSAKSVTTSAGQMLTDTTYYPWGQIWAYAGTGWGAQFAGLPIGFNAATQYVTPYRPYEVSQGRWLSPDPDNAGANPSNPQSWDAYSYAGNNPTTNTDPTGLYCVKNNNGNLVDEGSGGESCADGQKIVRVDTNAARPHYNFENKITGGNLHVYF
ncbi:MAG: RHS repeat-associated core domain-containing protein [Terriglobia bacterium]